MNFVFSNGVDELKIELPSTLKLLDDWFESLIYLKVEQLYYVFTATFQKEDFFNFKNKLINLLKNGECFEFNCLEEWLNMRVEKYDELGHFCMGIVIQNDKTKITTSFLLSYYDIENVIKNIGD